MRTRSSFSIISVAVFGLLFALPARAVSNRIFMSTNGNNASDCADPLTPCLTFAGALAQVNPGGEVIAEATGGYGPLSITSAVTVSGPPGVVIYSGLGVTVNAPAATVVLRGLTIDGTGAATPGINVISVGNLFIESCVIANFTMGGISSSAVNGNVFVKDTISRQNGFGLSMGAGRATVDHCRFESNVHSGVFVNAADVTVRDSVSAGNSFNGFEAVTHTTESTVLNVYNCASANNANDGFGVRNDGTGSLTARVANSTFIENTGHGLNNFSGTVTFESLGNNFVQGNVAGTTNGTITAVSGH